MKRTRTWINAVILAGSLATATLASAQTATTTTSSSSTTCTGTVNSFGPDAITVQSTTSPAPVSYSYSKTTTYVDQAGNPVSLDVVKSGLPVTVYYSQDAGRMVASKVVVQRTTTNAVPAPAPTDVETHKSTSTTTTTSGQ